MASLDPEHRCWRGEEEKLRQRERIRAKYEQRLREKKIDLYFKALEIVRAAEMASKKRVFFTVNFASHFGQELVIVGGLRQLGSWDCSKGLKMRWNEGNNWTADIQLEETDVENFEYKYVVQDGHDYNWEWGNNHQVVIEKGRSEYMVADVWGAGGGPLG